MPLTSTLRFITSHPLTKEEPLSAIARFIRWQVESRLHNQIEFDWIDGAKLIVKRGMTGATGNIYCGLHEFSEMAFLLHLLRKGDVFLDVGANIGSYTVLASKLCSACSIAFEPDPDSARWLRKNVTVNNLDTLVIVKECALGNRNGEASFTMGLDTMNHVACSDDEHVQTVPIKRLDDIPEAADPTFIKLDVEGFEEEILLGASRVLASSSLLAVQSELCSPLVESMLDSFGFQHIYYDPFRRQIGSLAPDAQPQNSLFIRDLDCVLARISNAVQHKVLGIAI